MKRKIIILCAATLGCEVTVSAVPKKKHTKQVESNKVTTSAKAVKDNEVNTKEESTVYFLSDKDPKLEKKSHDFGVIRFQKDTKEGEYFIASVSNGEIINSGTRVQAIFKFRNDGKKDVKIEKITTSCGCTNPMRKEEYENKSIAPGKEFTIPIVFSPQHKSTTVSKSVTVKFAPPEKEQYLSITGRIDFPEEPNKEVESTKNAPDNDEGSAK